MKDKIKRFLIDKKELLMFIAVVLVVFATVITIATLALKETPVEQPTIGDEQTPPVIDPTDEPNEPVVTIKTFALPISGEHEVVRTFFDANLPDEQLASAIISNGSYMIESKGMSYSKPDNSVFDVTAIYEGVVTEVIDDELYGVSVTIKHSDEVVSIYSSLSDVTVHVNDTISQGEVIGKASTSVEDIEAGVHVHLEILVNGNYVNPSMVYGKELTDIVNEK